MSGDPLTSLKTDILVVLRESSAADRLIDLGESILDAELTDEVLRRIPVLGTISALNQIRLGIKDRLFVRKLARLLHQLHEVPTHERSRFAQQLADDDTFRDRVLSHLILLLDRLDEIEKATLLGNALRALVLSRVTFEQFTRLASAIDHGHIADLRSLMALQADRGIETSWAFPLAALGLLEPQHGNAQGYFQVEVYQLSELGRLFRDTCARPG